MAEALTTIDALVASVWQSYVAANRLILNSARKTAASRAKESEADDVLNRQARFIVNNALGRPPGSIPLALFHSDTLYHLSDLCLDLPCYTMSGPRLFGGRQKKESRVLHSFVPTRRQRLLYVCHLYHLVIRIERDKVEVAFLPASQEEAVRLDQGKTKRSSRHIAWKFRLTAEQEKHLLAVPKTAAKPVYWRASFRRLWQWLTGKSGKA